MERDFDNLVECVLVEICARGDGGISLSELFSLVESLYNILPDADEETDSSATEIVGSLEQASKIVNSLRPISYDHFKNQFWQSLIAHPDIIVSDDQAKNGGLLEEEASLVRPSSPRQDQLTSANETDGAASIGERGSLQSASQPPQIRPPISKDDPATNLTLSSAKATSGLGIEPNENRRIYVSKDRLWQTLTGHDFDNAKIPTTEWQCLCAIAASIGAGIMEADLALQVGQDKSSVIKLTKYLIRRGYVEKRKVPNHGPRNCLLTCKTLKTRAKTIDQAATQNSPQSANDVIGSSFPVPEQTSNNEIASQSTQKLLQSVDSGHEPVSSSSAAAEVSFLPIDSTNSTPNTPKADDQLHRTSSRRPAPRRSYISEYNETPTSGRIIDGRKTGLIETSGSPHMNIGKSRSKQATFKTYDEYRREDGWPGVYFDLPNLSGQVIPGRPKKRMIAVFKSEKLKKVTFWQGHTTLGNKSPRDPGQEFVTPNHPHTPLKSILYPSLSETAPHKILKDSAPVTPYRSPYLSPPGPLSTPTGAITFSSKYSYLDTAIRTQERLYRSPYAASASSQSISLDLEPQKYTKYGVKEDHSRSYGSTKEEAGFDPAEDDELQAAIAVADNVSIPEAASRLACSLKGVAGNLVLSTHMKTLTFIASREGATFELALEISDILSPPAISKVDALRPELLITAGAEEEDVTLIHHFRFLASSVQKANNMRAKIVTAMTILEFEQDNSDSKTAGSVVEKLFKCDTCSGSWKNMEGIKYHKTKAQVPCNPNYKLRTEGRSRVGRRNPATNTPSPFHHKFAELEYYSVDAALNDAEELQSAEDAQDNECEAGGEIAATPVTNKELSAFEVSDGVEKRQVDKDLTTTGLSDTNREKRSEGMINRHPFGRASSEIEPVVMRGTIRPRRKFEDSVSKAAALEATKRRKDVIISMLQRNSGVFPGDRGLWYGFLTSWVALFPHAGLPRYTDVNAALALLEDSGQVHKIQFTFQDDLGLMRMRAIITEKEVDLRGPVVTDLKQAIKAKFPEFYVPPQFAPPKTVQSMIDSIEGRQGAAEEPSTPASSIDDDTASDTGLEDDSDAALRQVIELDDDDDDDYVEGSKQRSHKSQRPTPRKQGRLVANYTPSGKRVRVSKAVTCTSNTEIPELRRRLSGKILDEANSDSVGDSSTLEPSGSSSGHPQAPGISHEWYPAFVYLQDPVNSTWSLASSKPTKKLSTRRKFESSPSGKTAKPPASKGTPNQGSEARKRKRLSSQLDQEVEPRRLRKRKVLSYEERLRASPELQSESKSTPMPDFRPRKFPAYASRSNKLLYQTRNPGLDSLATGRIAKLQNLSIELVFENFHPYADFSSEIVSHGNFSEPVFPASSNSSSTSTLVGSTSVPSVFDTSAITYQDDPFTVRWEPPVILKQHSGTWESMTESEFEGSFSIQGQFPSAKYFLRQNLLADLMEIIDVSDAEKSNIEKVPNKRWADCSSNVEKIASWERGAGQAILARGTIAPDYYFVNLSFPSHRMPPRRRSAKLVWSDRNTFTLENLPYEELKTEDEEEISLLPTSSSSKNKKLDNLHGFGGFSQKKTRRMTALPADIDGLLDVISSDPDFHVEVAYDQDQSIRKRTEEQVLSNKLEDRILLSTIVIRTLTGGIDRTIDWVLVARLHPEITVNFIQRRWTSVQQANATKIEKLSAKFQEFYIQAYEAGLVPAIDYDRLLDYNFEDVINLFENNVDLTAVRESATATVSATPDLPSTRTSLNSRFSLFTAEEHRLNDAFYSSLTPVHKRMDYATAAQHTTAVHHKPHHIDDTLFLTAKSWIRANCLTPEARYNAGLAEARLSEIPRGLLRAATESLISAKVLTYRNKGRAVPGRALESSETFNSAFRKHVSEMHCAQAVAYKFILDQAFRARQDVTVRWDSDEGTVLALTNLQAWDRIKIEPRNEPRLKFGLIPHGSYQTKQMDKTKLRFDLVVYRTETYAFGGFAEVLGRVSEAPPMGAVQMLPIWYDIHGQLIPDLWRKVLCAVLGTIAFRPGTNVSEIVRSFNPAMEAWEARLLMEWGERVGLVARTGDGEREGWTVGEWWWLVGGLA